MDEMPTSPIPQLSRAEQAHSYRKVKVSYSAKTRKKLKDEGMVTVVAITGVPVQYRKWWTELRNGPGNFGNNAECFVAMIHALADKLGQKLVVTDPKNAQKVEAPKGTLSELEDIPLDPVPNSHNSPNSPQ